ncbi:MAG: 30S ribosomal protein S2 [Bacteroidetes bacterium]|nr:MAG: 30S ribosomal protein S2 [Bacteroidota bacterium]
MSPITFEQLLEAGVHFGHLKRRWNPAFAPYIYGEKNGVHIIDLNKTLAKLDEACKILKNLAQQNKTILFVATKKQAKEIIENKVKPLGMPYIVERWPGGLLTNFATIRRSIKRMYQIEKMETDGTFDKISKKEKLLLTREKNKIEKQFGSIANMNRLPAALFIVDIVNEHIAVKEAKRLNIPTFAMVDTNSNPNEVTYPIPANDDAASSIDTILTAVCNAIAEGLNERDNSALHQDKQEGEYDDTLQSKYELVESEEETETPKKIRTRKRTIKK